MAINGVERGLSVAERAQKALNPKVDRKGKSSKEETSTKEIDRYVGSEKSSKQKTSEKKQKKKKKTKRTRSRRKKGRSKRKSRKKGKKPVGNGLIIFWEDLVRTSEAAEVLPRIPGENNELLPVNFDRADLKEIERKLLQIGSESIRFPKIFDHSAEHLMKLYLNK